VRKPVVLTSYFAVFILSKKCLGCSFQWVERNTLQRFLLCTSPYSSHSTIYAYNYVGCLYTKLKNKKDAFNIFAAHSTNSHQRTWKNTKCCLVAWERKVTYQPNGSKRFLFPTNGSICTLQGEWKFTLTIWRALPKVTTCTCKVIHIEFTADLRDCQNRWSNNSSIRLLNDLLSIRTSTA